MNLSNDHIAGFAVGAGAAALGFYLYKKNQTQVDAWLQQQGINIPTAAGSTAKTSSMEELIREKERLEDLIAEREMEARESVAES